METYMETVLEHDMEYDTETLVLHTPVSMRRPSTVQEYCAMPEGAPYFQFIQGKAVEMPAPSIVHQDIIFNIASAIKAYLRTNAIGKVIIAPVDVHFSDSDYYEPDIVFVANEHINIISKNRIQGAPDLVVEVLSPSTGYHDQTTKKAIYEQEGVREYWLVHPAEHRVEILRNDGAKQGFVLHSQAQKQGVVRSAVLEGFSLALAEIFE